MTSQLLTTKGASNHLQKVTSLDHPESANLDYLVPASLDLQEAANLDPQEAVSLDPQEAHSTMTSPPSLLKDPRAR